MEIKQIFEITLLAYGVLSITDTQEVLSDFFSKQSCLVL